ncbi:Uma2 family endonuclease [Desulfosporosinus meridiei]|uniref:Uma2 family endonuclease n=1 Tax=Desulfosporosinus meridiei TaxID=79209 RepID=UPI0011D2C5EA|nr:Uma2 family endonuclease [Desulfosporosinus meridiei]
MTTRSNDVRKHTYTDYLLFPGDERWEIIDGVPYMQSAPSWQHQSISRELLRQFANYMLGKPCEVFAAPFDLGLSEAGKKDKDITDVYQPEAKSIYLNLSFDLLKTSQIV